MSLEVGHRSPKRKRKRELSQAEAERRERQRQKISPPYLALDRREECGEQAAPRTSVLVGVGHNRGPPIDDPAHKCGKLAPTRKVMQRYSCSDRTIDRWVMDPDLGFPKPFYIKRRRYWRESDLDRFDAARAEAS